MVRDTRTTGMEADGMTVKEMDARLNELEIEIDELDEQTDIEKFCDECEHIRVAQDIENFWGVKCRREYAVCPADFTPYWNDCPRCAEYEELTDKLTALREEHEKLSAAYDAAVA